MIDLQLGGLETKMKLKGNNLNPLELQIGFVN